MARSAELHLPVGGLQQFKDKHKVQNIWLGWKRKKWINRSWALVELSTLRSVCDTTASFLRVCLSAFTSRQTIFAGLLFKNYDNPDGRPARLKDSYTERRRGERRGEEREEKIYKAPNVNTFNNKRELVRKSSLKSSFIHFQHVT